MGATPSARQSERALVSLAQLDPKAIIEAQALGIRPHDFWDAQHRAAWAALAGSADGATLLEALERDGIGRGQPWKDAGALVAYVTDLQKAAAHRYRLPRYVEQLQEARARRGVQAGAQKLLAMLEEGATTDDLLEAQQLNTRQTAAATGGRVEVVTASQLYAESQLPPAEGSKAGERLLTGFKSLDGEIKLHRGDYGMVIGASGHGKTFFAMSLAEGIAKTMDCDVLFVSGEMDRGGLMKRIRDRRPAFDETRVHIVFERRFDRILSLIRTFPSEVQNYGAVFLDYWQFLKYQRHPEGRAVQLHEASKDFCEAGRGAGGLSMMVVQANKVKIEERPIWKRAPFLSDAYECKAIEHDVDVGLALHTEALWPDGRSWEGQEMRSLVIPRKQREGAAGKQICMRWDRERGWWRDPTAMESMSDTQFPPGDRPPKKKK